MHDLNSLLEPNSGWILRDAQGINEKGQIVGFGEFEGESRAYLLTPVPEPSTLFITSLGLLAAIGCQRTPAGWRRR
jgi:hypothetical protein